MVGRARRRPRRCPGHACSQRIFSTGFCNRSRSLRRYSRDQQQVDYRDKGRSENEAPGKESRGRFYTCAGCEVKSLMHAAMIRKGIWLKVAWQNTRERESGREKISRRQEQREDQALYSVPPPLSPRFFIQVSRVVWSCLARTSSSTKTGAPILMAMAIASLGRESIWNSLLFWSR